MSLKTPFDVEHIAGDLIRVRQRIVWHGKLGKVEVPAGFVCDGSSIPRATMALVPPNSLSALVAGVLHDLRYWDGAWGRKDADALWYDAYSHSDGGEYAPPAVRSWLAWAALRSGGWVAWRKHRKAGHDASNVMESAKWHGVDS